MKTTTTYLYQQKTEKTEKKEKPLNNEIIVKVLITIKGRWFQQPDWVTDWLFDSLIHTYQEFFVGCWWVT